MKVLGEAGTQLIVNKIQLVTGIIIDNADGYGFDYDFIPELIRENSWPVPTNDGYAVNWPHFNYSSMNVPAYIEIKGYSCLTVAGSVENYNDARRFMLIGFDDFEGNAPMAFYEGGLVIYFGRNKPAQLYRSNIISHVKANEPFIIDCETGCLMWELFNAAINGQPVLIKGLTKPDSNSDLTMAYSIPVSVICNQYPDKKIVLNCALGSFERAYGSYISFDEKFTIDMFNPNDNLGGNEKYEEITADEVRAMFDE